MSENQQPLTDEQAETAPVEPVDLSAETNEVTDAIAPAEEQPEEEVDIDPADVHIFGMPRIGFHCTAFGVAGGYIVCGLVGILAEKTAGTPIGDLAAKSPDAWIWAIVFAAVGYLIGKQKHKKRMATKEAEEAARAEEADGVSPEAEHPEA